MEKTQTGQLRARSRNDYMIGTLGNFSLKLHYLTADEFDAQQSAMAENILGAIAFGSSRPILSVTGIPSAWIDMPLLDGGAVFEVWTSDKPVTHSNESGIVASQNDDVLFGCLELNEANDLEFATHQAYSRIFDFIDDRGYEHLLRIWNYFPRINEVTNDLERYRSFSIGRHDAFLAKGRHIDAKSIPAACALGGHSGPLTIYFLAGKTPGCPVENPRQTSAYYYPAQYGPRSPTFSRAMAFNTGRQSQLFISGTASIVGHETRHIGDVLAQTRETIVNIRAVIDQAVFHGQANLGNETEVILKAYLRHAEDLSIVRDQLSIAFGSKMKAIYLQADICRSDLLVEVEGVCLNRTGR